jgi:hypothetical protein
METYLEQEILLQQVHHKVTQDHPVLQQDLDQEEVAVVEQVVPHQLKHLLVVLLMLHQEVLVHQ